MNYFLKIFIDFLFFNSNSNLKNPSGFYRAVPLPHRGGRNGAVTNGKKNLLRSRFGVRDARVRAQVASWTTSRTERRAGAFQGRSAWAAHVRARGVRGRVNRVWREAVRITGERTAGVISWRQRIRA
jgi:hypothetical protein